MRVVVRGAGGDDRARHARRVGDDAVGHVARLQIGEGRAVGDDVLEGVDVGGVHVGPVGVRQDAVGHREPDAGGGVARRADAVLAGKVEVALAPRAPRAHAAAASAGDSGHAGAQRAHYHGHGQNPALHGNPLSPVFPAARATAAWRRRSSIRLGGRRAKRQPPVINLRVTPDVRPPPTLPPCPRSPGWLWTGPRRSARTPSGCAGRVRDPGLAGGRRRPRRAVVAGDGDGDVPALVRVPRAGAAAADDTILLGLDGGDRPVRHRPRRAARGASATAIDGGQVMGLREAGALLAPAEAGLAAYAMAMLNWHRRHRFCANCGNPTDVAEAGYSRHCPRCGADHFPAHRPGGDHDRRARRPAAAGAPHGLARRAACRCWPASSPRGSPPRRRWFARSQEESGIIARDPVFVASQPWPFPASLMLGFHAVSDGGEPRATDGELEERGLASRAATRSGRPVRGRRPGRSAASAGGLDRALLDRPLGRRRATGRRARAALWPGMPLTAPPRRAPAPHSHTLRPRGLDAPAAHVGLVLGERPRQVAVEDVAARQAQLGLELDRRVRLQARRAVGRRAAGSPRSARPARS